MDLTDSLGLQAELLALLPLLLPTVHKAQTSIGLALLLQIAGHKRPLLSATLIPKNNPQLRNVPLPRIRRDPVPASRGGQQQAAACLGAAGGQAQSFVDLRPG